jgi:hypothetical protein
MAWKPLQSHRLGQLEPAAGSKMVGYAQLYSESVTPQPFRCWLKPPKLARPAVQLRW